MDDPNCLWRRGHQYDPVAVDLANRHYSRRSHASPKFMPPGRACVLVLLGGGAVWACSWPQPQMVKRAYPRAWLNVIFRRECGPQATDLIRTALGVTRFLWGDPPADGVLTIIDESKVRPTVVRGKNVYGWTYRKVGFIDAGRTKKKGLLMLQLPPELVPAPLMPCGHRHRVPQPTLFD